MTQRNLLSYGFTLIELAMVLFIVSLLIAGLLMPLAAQNEIRGRQETDRALANIREALIGFAVVNGRLPCPADRTIDSKAANAGVEAVTSAGGPCACTDNAAGIAAIGTVACDHDDNGSPSGVTGVLPWATLGLSEADAWGNRYSYRITTRFGRALANTPGVQFGCVPTRDPPTSSAFALCSVGDISVRTAATGGTIVASAVPAIVVSHGKNGYGAYQSTGIQIGTPADQTTSDPLRDAYVNRLLADQRENSDGSTNNIFVTNTDIDDQLVWLPTSILMGRMLSAGKLP